MVLVNGEGVRMGARYRAKQLDGHRWHFSVDGPGLEDRRGWMVQLASPVVAEELVSALESAYEAGMRGADFKGKKGGV